MLSIDLNKTISVRIKTPGSKKNLLIAFAIAFILHAVGIGLFHIKPFLIPETQWTFPPVLVDSGYKPTQGHNVAIQSEWNIKMPKTVLIPKTSTPDLNETPFINELPPVDLTVALKPISIRLNGTLNEKIQLIEPPQKPLFLSSSHVLQHKGSYKVHISKREEKIFWLELQDGDLDAYSQKTIEDFLLQSSFKSNSSDAFLTGDIEVVYTQENI
jgi:hypothetical protein